MVSGAALSREELFAGWRLFFERLAAVQPVVLLIEDAQYADSGLLDFLDLRRQRIGGHRQDLAAHQVRQRRPDDLLVLRGSYQFAQQMLRQVAYDTLSRRDRKTRHLAVAAHLRVTFAGDGEEMADVIARHYLDALHAVPDDPDTAQIRGQAIAALIRAAERAERTGAPAPASYAAAAELTLTETAAGPPHTVGEAPDAGMLWERAAQAATATTDYAAAIHHAGRAHDYYLQRGQARAAARAQAITGRVLRIWGRHAEARERLTAAITGLREHSTPYHLAHGLLDHAGYLTRHDDAEAAVLAIEEARTIGNRLRCRPLLDRADAMEDARTRIRA